MFRSSMVGRSRGVRFRRSILWSLAAVVCLLAHAPSAYADETQAAERARPNWFRRTFAFGGRVSVGANPLFKSETFLQSTSSPAWRLDRATDWTGFRAGGGASMQIRLSDRFGLFTDVIFRKVSYTSKQELTVGVDNTSTTTDERSITTTTENTRVYYWDLPVLARVYYGRRERADFRRFFEAGLAFRRVGSIRTARNITGPDDEETTDTNGPAPANRTVMGWVAGAGVQATDDFGLKLAPEVRYTRWTRDTFAATPAFSSRHQLEFLVGIVF